MRLPCGLEDFRLPLKTSQEQCASLLMTFLKMERQEFCEAFLTLQLAGSLCHATPKENKQKKGKRKLITDEEFQRLKHHSNLYKEKFGFTFVICARLLDTKDQSML